MQALILIFLACSVYASDGPPQLKDLNEKAKAVEKKYRVQERELHRIDVKIFRTQEKIDRVKKDIREKQGQAGDLKSDLDCQESVLLRQKEKMQSNWVGLYKGSFLDMVNMYCSHQEYIGYLKSVMEHNYEVLSEYNETLGKIKKARHRVDDVAGILKRDLEKLEDAKQELNLQRKKKAAMLVSLKRESDDYQDRIRQQLNKIEAEKREKELASGSIFRKKGKLPWPVKGSVVRRFGTFEVRGIAQRSQGIDIETKEGAPVRSIYDGTVVYVNWMNRYGNTIIVDHGGGYYSVYGHLQKFVKSIGEKVFANETIALVGQTGDVLQPTLHFELRFHDKPQDPGVWLAAE